MSHNESPSSESSIAAASPASPKEAHVEVLWDQLQLSQGTLSLIEKAGFKKPTPVQAQAIPIALDGHDLIASAQTGTGKTASFVLPMVEKLKGREGTYGLILCPTREIAQQTQATIELFGAPQGIRSIVLIGGIDMKIDARALQSYPQIIVATPGRLCDHLDRGNVWLDFIEVVVLDEADRMLDMGFADQLSRIMSDVPKDRQTLLFSATMPPDVEHFARRILYHPERVAIGRPLSAATTVEQRLLWMKEESRNRELRRLLRQETGSVIVFTRSKDMASRVWRSLHSHCFYDATFIHSDRPQDQREQALADFKEGKFRILIATDVAGRGIHVDDVAHVINYELPLEPEDYIHRIGRTGRANATGKATSFASPRDRHLLRRIEHLLGHPIPSETVDNLPSGGHSSGHSRGHRSEHKSENRSGHSSSRSASASDSHSSKSHRSAHGPSHKANTVDHGKKAASASTETATGTSEAAPQKRRRRRRGGRGKGSKESHKPKSE